MDIPNIVPIKEPMSTFVGEFLTVAHMTLVEVGDTKSSTLGLCWLILV